VNTESKTLYARNRELALTYMSNYIQTTLNLPEEEAVVKIEQYRKALGVPYNVVVDMCDNPIVRQIEAIGEQYRAEDELLIRKCKRGHLYHSDNPAPCPYCENTFKPVDYQPLQLRRAERALNWGFVVVAVALLCGFVWAMGSGAEQDAKNQEQYLSGYPKQEVRDVR